MTPTDVISEFLKMAQAAAIAPAAPKSPKSEPFITRPADIGRALMQLRVAHQFINECFAIQTEAVRLAADQVQDVRITLVERGPELSAADWAVPFLLTLCLESSIAGALVAGATKTLFKTIKKVELATETAAQIRALGPLIGTHGAERLIGDSSTTLAAMTKRFETVAEAFAEDKGVPALKGLYAGVQGYRSAESTDAVDTAGVTIQEAAFTFASEQRLWLGERYAEYEGLLFAHRLTEQKLVGLTQLAQTPDLTALRRGYARHFEAVIWAALFRFSHKDGAYVDDVLERVVHQDEYFDAEHPPPGRMAKLFGPLKWYGLPSEGDSRLLDYWAHRLIDPASKGMLTFAATAQKPEEAKMAVGRHLCALGKMLIENPNALVAVPVEPLPKTR